MYSSIEKHIQPIIRDQKLGAAVQSYAALLSQVSRTNVTHDLEFQRDYRQFWALNAARLDTDRIRDYFDLLEAEKHGPFRGIDAIVRDLAARSALTGENPTLQFSFASKLLHMLYPENPVYDSLVAAFYFYTPPTGASFERKLRSLLDFYEFLQSEYYRVISGSLLGNASDQKVVDFLIWTYVRLLRRGAQRGGTLLYT
jgi:hypothetical protein